MAKTTTPGPHKASPKKVSKKKSPKAEETTTAEQQQIQAALTLLKPLTDFHQAVEDACQDDLRLMWDVRLVRGKDTPFCHVHGTTSLPAMLAYNMLGEAPSIIHEEIRDKIAKPLVAFMQSYAENFVPPRLPEQKSDGDYSSEEECFPKESGDPFGTEQTSPPENLGHQTDE